MLKVKCWGGSKLVISVYRPANWNSHLKAIVEGKGEAKSGRFYSPLCHELSLTEVR